MYGRSFLIVCDDEVDTGGDGVSSDAPLLVFLYIGLCFLSSVPFAFIEHPPIMDLPNHAARMFLECSMGDPAVASMYRVSFGLIPNLAIDAVNVPLCGLFEPIAFLKGIIILALVAIYGACWAIQRTLFGQANAMVLLVPAISINVVTSMGYINFLVGIAILMWMLVACLRMPRQLHRIIIGNFGGILLFFSHIFALALATVFFFGLLLPWGKLTVQAIVRTGMRTLAMFAFPLLLILFVESGGQGFNPGYAAKLRAIAAPFLGFERNFAFILSVAVYICVYLLLRQRLVRVHPSMRMVLTIGLAYVVLVPCNLQAAVDIDSRSMVALSYVFLAAVSPSTTKRLLQPVLLLSALTLTIVNLTIVATQWRKFDSQVSELRAALDILPATASVLSVRHADTPGSALPGYSVVYTHLASYATLDRRVFNPLEFTGRGMQPLRSIGRFEAIDVGVSMPISTDRALQLAEIDRNSGTKALPGSSRYAWKWRDNFDYVLYYHFGRDPNFDPAHLRLRRNGSFFSILENVGRRAPAPGHLRTVNQHHDTTSQGQAGGRTS